MKIYDVLEYLLQNQSSGGGGEDSSTTRWCRLPVYGLDGSDNVNTSVELASLYIPYNTETGLCLYSSWSELLQNTSDVNAGFVFSHFEYEEDRVDYIESYATILTPFLDKSKLPSYPDNPLTVLISSNRRRRNITNLDLSATDFSVIPDDTTLVFWRYEMLE